MDQRDRRSEDGDPDLFGDRCFDPRGQKTILLDASSRPRRLQDRQDPPQSYLLKYMKTEKERGGPWPHFGERALRRHFERSQKPRHVLLLPLRLSKMSDKDKEMDPLGFQPTQERLLPLSQPEAFLMEASRNEVDLHRS
jgi:hypothetical protein